MRWDPYLRMRKVEISWGERYFCVHYLSLILYSLSRTSCQEHTLYRMTSIHRYYREFWLYFWMLCFLSSPGMGYIRGYRSMHILWVSSYLVCRRLMSSFQDQHWSLYIMHSHSRHILRVSRESSHSRHLYRVEGWAQYSPYVPIRHYRARDCPSSTDRID